MTHEQWQNLFGGIYALLGLILLAICVTLIYLVMKYTNETDKEKQIKELKTENEDLRQRIKIKTEIDRLRYEQEQLIKKMKEDEEK